jgi:hypothetical protein
MQTRTLLVVFCAAAAVLIAALLLRPDDTSAETGRASQTAPAAQPSRTETELLTPAPDAEHDTARSNEAGVVRAAVEHTPTRATLTGRVLRDALPVAQARVSVSRGVSDLAQYAVRTQAVNVTPEVREQQEAREYVGPLTECDAEGRFRIDISSLFRSGPPAALWIQVSAPTSRANHFELPLPTSLRDAAPAEFEHDVTLELEPACVVHVAFTFATGEQAQGEQPNKRSPPVKVVRVEGDDKLQQNSPSLWRHGRNGEHEIGLECGERYVLLSADSGWRPIGVSVQPSAETHLGRFELERGAAVSGRVVSDGAPARALVTLELVGGGPRTHLFNDEFCELNGAYERARLSVQTNANGEFRAEGLATARYKVRVAPADSPSATGDREREIEVPADNVVFELELGQIDLRVRRAGAPAVGQLISIHHRSANGNSGGALVTDKDGAALLRLRPDQRTTLELRWREFKGGPEYVRQVDAPFPGVGQRAELVIEL